MGTCAKEGPVLILLATRDGPNIAKYLFVKLCSVLHFSRPATPEAFADGPKHTCLISMQISETCKYIFLYFRHNRCSKKWMKYESLILMNQVLVQLGCKAPADFRGTWVSLVLTGLCGQDLGTVLLACA